MGGGREGGWKGVMEEGERKERMIGREEMGREKGEREEAKGKTHGKMHL